MAVPIKYHIDFWVGKVTEEDTLSRTIGDVNDRVNANLKHPIFFWKRILGSESENGRDPKTVMYFLKFPGDPVRKAFLRRLGQHGGNPESLSLFYIFCNYLTTTVKTERLKAGKSNIIGEPKRNDDLLADLTWDNIEWDNLPPQAEDAPPKVVVTPPKALPPAAQPPSNAAWADIAASVKEEISPSYRRFCEEVVLTTNAFVPLRMWREVLPKIQARLPKDIKNQVDSYVLTAWCKTGLMNTRSRRLSAVKEAIMKASHWSPEDVATMRRFDSEFDQQRTAERKAR